MPGHGRARAHQGWAGENSDFFSILLRDFLWEVAKFVKMQFFDMLHHVMGEIDLHRCFQLRCKAFHQSEGQLILPEQMAVAIHKIQIEAS